MTELMTFGKTRLFRFGGLDLTFLLICILIVDILAYKLTEE
jgi:hypothetical protein